MQHLLWLLCPYYWVAVGRDLGDTDCEDTVAHGVELYFPVEMAQREGREAKGGGLGQEGTAAP